MFRRRSPDGRLLSKVEQYKAWKRSRAGRRYIKKHPMTPSTPAASLHPRIQAEPHHHGRWRIVLVMFGAAIGQLVVTVIMWWLSKKGGA